MRLFSAERTGLWRPLLLLLLLWVPISAAYAQAPVALAGADRTICSGLGTTLGDNNPIAGLTYRWTPTTGLNNATIHNPRATISNTTPAPISRTYALTVTDASGATATDSVRVTVLPRPFIDAGFDQTICSGQTITVGSPALPGHSYAWTADPFLSNPSIAQPTYTPINPSGASFFRDLVLIVRGPNGCDATARVRITVNPAIVAAAGPNQTSCAGQTLTLGTPALAGYSYTWRPTTGLDNPNAAQPILTTANAGAFPVATIYTLTVNANGCIDSSRATVTVFPAVAADAGAAVAVCAGQSAPLAAGLTPVPGTTYRWSPATGLSNPNSLNPTVNLATPGTFIYTLTATTTPAPGAACSSTDSVAVTVDALPTPQAAPTPGTPVELCAGATALLGGGAAVPGLTYQWRPVTGLATPTAATTTVSLPNPTNSPLTTVYTLIATSGAGCVDSSQVTVQVNPLAVADAGPNVTVCAAQPVTLGTPPVPGYSYRWTPTTGLSSPTLAQPILTMVNSTSAPLNLTYYVTVTLPSGACAAVDSVTVTVQPTPAVAAISGPAFVCDFGSTVAYSVPAVPGTTFQWTVVGGTIAAGQGTAQAVVQFAPGSASYAVTAVPTSATGCAGVAVALPVTFDNPALLPTLASVETTSNTQVTLGFTAPGSANTPTQVQVLRRIAGQGTFAVIGTTSPTTNTFVDATVDAAANSYEYRLELTNGCGALLTSPILQTIRLTALADAADGAALSWNAYVGFPVQEYRVFRSLDGAPPALLTTVPGTTLQTVIPSGTADGGGFRHEFRIVAISPDPIPQQANSNTATLTFANAISPHNIITPNGDGLNETLVFDNLRFYPNSALRIYNRWGRQLLDTPDYRNDWGAATDVAPGTYFYLLQLPNGTSTRGWVEVVK